ncbi:MAG: methionine--tRNA ligase [Patescibacteria group bacterium]|nr:methionine--tRNA ligase [Patescibacteria group bacterium]
MNKFYITTAIPYVNAKPHIGHALEFVQADTIARYHKLKEEEVLLLSGGDENALKNVQEAEKEKTPIQDFVDKYSQLFLDLSRKLNVEFDVFQKGSDTKHHESTQELWKRCFESGDIYKKVYTGLYCVGCELFYEKNELNENGECFEHPGKRLDEVSEENWFFRLSKYEKDLKRIINNKNDPDYIEIIPEKRKHEVQSFLESGLKDISISRSNARAKNWGVQVPNDPDQRIYVWFDALNIYQSGIGFNYNPEKYKKWWPADLHTIGKGILRFHAIYWPAFLLSAKLKLPKSIFVHGYFTVNGQKMSKSLGNVIDPVEMINKYGTDALRYYLLKEIPSAGDGDFSEERLKTAYNADLANGLGNLVARVAKMSEQINLEVDSTESTIEQNVSSSIENFEFDKTLKLIWQKIKESDTLINEKEIWKLEKQEKGKILTSLIETIRQIGFDLEPFLPETSQKIKDQFKGPKIKSSEPLFPRIN